MVRVIGRDILKSKTPKQLEHSFSIFANLVNTYGRLMICNTGPVFTKSNIDRKCAKLIFGGQNKKMKNKVTKTQFFDICRSS